MEMCLKTQFEDMYKKLEGMAGVISGQFVCLSLSSVASATWLHTTLRGPAAPHVYTERGREGQMGGEEMFLTLVAPLNTKTNPRQ